MVFTTEKQSVYCTVRTGSLYIKQIRFVFKGLTTKDLALPWPMWLVAGLSPRRPGFDPKSAMLWTKWYRDGFFFRVLDFPLSLSFRLRAIFIFIMCCSYQKDKRRSLRNFQKKAMLFRKLGNVR
jgi:hypothetical protein